MTTTLRGRYLVRNPIGNAWLRASDALLALIPRNVPASNGSPPQRLLLAVGGHLGDAVIATSVLGPIRAAWPSVEIGVVTSSWNRQVFANHPEIRWLHLADHWKLDRSGRAWIMRAMQAAASQRAALREIQANAYDVALDLYPYYPNASRLLKRSRIPTRVGYASGGGGPRYTHALEWMPGGHVIEDHLRVLAVMGIARGDGMPNYRLAPRSKETGATATRKLLAFGVTTSSYIVLHMGAGTSQKLWPIENWSIVARALLAKQLAIVLTGAGSRDVERARELQQRVPGVLDACDALTWDELRHVLAEARATISVDTSAAHLSAAEGTPTTVVMTGADDAARWRPLGRHVRVISDNVTADAVLAATQANLESRLAGTPQ